MKKIFTLLTAAFISLNAAGQDDMPDFSGFESDMIKPATNSGVNFCGGITYDFGFIGENAAAGCTGLVGANFYNKLRVGGYFNGLLGVSDYSGRYYFPKIQSYIFQNSNQQKSGNRIATTAFKLRGLLLINNW